MPESPSWPKLYSLAEAPQELLALTARLMPLLLEGDHPTFALLREQYARSTIRQVKLTGSGFFVEFDIPADVARSPTDFAGGDATLEIEGVKHGAGCVLFVKAGVITMLEGYTYGAEGWPEHPVVRDVRDVLSLFEATARRRGPSPR